MVIIKDRCHNCKMEIDDGEYYCKSCQLQFELEEKESEPYSIADDCWISKEEYDKLPDEEKWIWDRKKGKARCKGK